MPNTPEGTKQEERTTHNTPSAGSANTPPHQHHDHGDQEPPKKRQKQRRIIQTLASGTSRSTTATSPAGNEDAVQTATSSSRARTDHLSIEDCYDRHHHRYHYATTPQVSPRLSPRSGLHTPSTSAATNESIADQMNRMAVALSTTLEQLENHFTREVASPHRTRTNIDNFQQEIQKEAIKTLKGLQEEIRELKNKITAPEQREQRNVSTVYIGQDGPTVHLVFSSSPRSANHTGSQNSPNISSHEHTPTAQGTNDLPSLPTL